jgi:small conductance mechanosensitive channel
MLEDFTQTDYVNLYVIPWSIKIISALLIFIIGRWIAKAIVRFVEKLMMRSKLDAMLVAFIGNIAYALLLAVVILATLEQLGVETTSALAILGAAGLAIGLALQSSLSNFAAGVMLIMFRPFKVGDYVEAGGTAGIVETIAIFSTMMRTGDNREVTIPNGQIYGSTIINYSARETRRIDMMFSIGYGDDIRKAKSIIEEVLKAEEHILDDPAPTIMLMELGASSVDIAVRPWVKSADYWTVRAFLLEEIKTRFDASGISIPFPQQDVHVKEFPARAAG